MHEISISIGYACIYSSIYACVYPCMHEHGLDCLTPYGHAIHNDMNIQVNLVIWVTWKIVVVSTWISPLMFLNFLQWVLFPYKLAKIFIIVKEKPTPDRCDKSSIMSSRNYLCSSLQFLYYTCASVESCIMCLFQFFFFPENVKLLFFFLLWYRSHTGWEWSPGRVCGEGAASSFSYLWIGEMVTDWLH